MPPRMQRDTRESPPKSVPKMAACVWHIAEEIDAMDAPLQSLVSILAK